MRRAAKALGAAAAALVLIGSGCGGGGNGTSPPPSGIPSHGFDERRAYRDVVAQVEIGPRPSGSPGSARTVAYLADRLRSAGAREVVVQRPLRNVIGRIGKSGPVVVIGAHHDTKDIPGFVGANDGASGVAVVLETARAVRSLAEDGQLRGSFVFVLFDGEEARGSRPFERDGTRGSRQFVTLAEAGGAQGAPSLDSIEAMFLLDMVGDCDLSIPREGNSDPDLYALLEGDVFGGETGPILDDHIPFVEAGVPAVDVIDFDFGPGPTPGGYWHTTEDTLDKVCPRSLDAAGEAVVGALLELRG